MVSRWQALLLTYVSMLQIPSTNASLLDISQPIETWRRLADYQPVTKRVGTFLLMKYWLSACHTNVSERLLLTTRSFDLFIDMSIMSTIKCPYLMRARCLKYIHYILPIQHHPVEIIMEPGYRKSGTQTRVLSQHSLMGTACMHTQKEGIKEISRCLLIAQPYYCYFDLLIDTAHSI